LEFETLDIKLHHLPLTPLKGKSTYKAYKFEHLLNT